ncbi:uncharacterized protein YALI1_D22932g [Yarrowia lipolytica]|uniref:Uncharacterized protein n=1 Tax=Yarrowia lipolytica TaxID=4952 RepID=A0A1D8NF46_YARLL|nr:hypothetical protein YALI1_D22932g [Yarrowia lipolytica]
MHSHSFHSDLIRGLWTVPFFGGDGHSQGSVLLQGLRHGGKNQPGDSNQCVAVVTVSTWETGGQIPSKDGQQSEAFTPLLILDRANLSSTLDWLLMMRMMLMMLMMRMMRMI